MHIGNQQKVSTMQSVNRPKRVEAPKPKVTTPEVAPAPVTAEAEKALAQASA